MLKNRKRKRKHLPKNEKISSQKAHTSLTEMFRRSQMSFSPCVHIKGKSGSVRKGKMLKNILK